MFKRSFLFLLVVVFLVGCGSNTNANKDTDKNANAKSKETEEVVYSGESDTWKAELKLVLEGDKEKREFTLTFTGDDYKSIEYINYDVVGPEEFSEEDASINVMQYVVSKETLQEATYADDDSDIEVNVEWNDETETIELEEE
ncbi:MAG TPA: hypothetical protein VK111_12315 [Virgibacillus sp.]|nr:hypothetical protein [Virgibacillus sp.]